MSKFQGFTDSETFTSIPDTFFRGLLHDITDADELKVTLYALWRIGHLEGAFRALRTVDFDGKELGLTADEVRSGIEKAVSRGSLIKSVHEAEMFYFLNSPRGRASAEAFAQGRLHGSARMVSAPPMERPNIFKLYEENIGPLTPLIADMLKEAEGIYRAEWFEEAFSIAVKYNKRNWKYVEAVLKRWKEEGRAKKQNRRDDKESRQRNVEDKIKKFVGG